MSNAPSSRGGGREDVTPEPPGAVPLVAGRAVALSFSRGCWNEVEGLLAPITVVMTVMRKWMKTDEW